MKRVIIVCEGETEKEFCKKMLAPFFQEKNIQIASPLIKKSMGGIVKWDDLKKQITDHLRNEQNVHVTTLIDYYGMYEKHYFPQWEDSLVIVDKNKRMDFLEDAMYNDVEDVIRYRYTPYIQLHEFEGLLFNDIAIFRAQIPSEDLIGLDELRKTFTDYSNPEMINDAKETSPSHRLERIVKGYNKIVHGNIIAEAIGLENLRAKSPRFNKWLSTIESI